VFGRAKPVQEFIRGCAIYLSAEHETTLVAAMFNHAGLFAEREGEVSLGPLRDAEALGRLTREALDGCAYQPEFNYRDRNRTDWPAFQRSGCRSVRQFEQAYDRLFVSGSNAANLVCTVESPTLGGFDLRLQASVSYTAPAREIGECIFYVWNTYRQVRQIPLADPAA
jgi:hypothetical protein